MMFMIIYNRIYINNNNMIYNEIDESNIYLD